MKNNYFLQWTQRLFFLLIIITGLNTNAQSFLITFPDHAAAPTQNPRNLTVCNSTSLLKVRMDVAAKSTSGATVSIQLPPGVEYIANSVTKVGGTTLLTISDNGGGANAPNFIIGPNDLLTGQFIEFTIDRRATCPSRTASIAGTAFVDVVSGTILGNSASTTTSSAYQLFYPVFSLTQPATQTNAIIGQTYTRNFTISNGGNGCATEVHFSIDNPANGIQQTGITLGGVTINPTSTVGTTSYYTVTSANLPGGDFCFGETLTFTETYIVRACNAITNYSVGWGCNASPASWCQTATGSGNVTMGTGVPNISLAFTRVSAGDYCIGDTWRYTYTNIGSENTPGGGTAFNINALLGTGAWGTPNAVIQAGGGNYLTNFTINGVLINFNPRSIGQGWTLDLSQLTSDPDGAGGLTDADGDGRFDDLPVGATLIIDYELKWDNTGTFFNQTCALDSAIDVTPNARINYTNQCGASLNNFNSSPISTLRYAYSAIDNTLSNNPSDVVNGTPFTSVFNLNVVENQFPGANSDQRLELRFTLPAGLSLASLNGFYQLNSGAMQPVTAVQTGNDVVITFLNTNINSQSHKFYFDFITSCPATNIEMPYRFVHYSVTCPSFEVVRECGTFKVTNHCPCDLSTTGGGVGSEIATAQRTTLGWTNHTLSTPVMALSLPAKSLKRLLTNDEARIQQNGTQLVGGSFDNLWVEASFGRPSLALPYVTILNTSSVTITDVSTGNIYVCPLPTAATSNVTATLETHTYNLGTLIGSTLPVGYMFEPGDTYQLNMNIKYTGNGTPGNSEILLPTNVQFYNKDTSNNTMGCGGSGVELYIIPFRGVTASYFNQSNLGTGCSNGSLSGSINQALNTELDPFPNEFRPSVYIDEMQFTLPVGFSYNPSGTAPYIRVFNDLSGSLINHTINPPTISGQVITFVNDGSWRLSDQGQNSSSSVEFVIPIISNCAATEGNNTLAPFTFKLRRNFYSYPNAPTMPNIPSLVDFPQTTITSLPLVRPYIGKPATTLSNQSGTLQAARPIESFTVRVASSGASAANNIWIAIQNNPNITITNVIDIATGTPLTGATYSNGNWYQLINTLAPSATRDVRIEFTYTTCTADALTVLSGWDCAGYPSSPDTYACTPSSVVLPFIPQSAAVQIIAVNQPATPVSLCTPIPFEYRMNSAGAGNTIDNTFVVELPVGISFATALEAEYPVGSGNWAAVTFTTAGTQTTVDLTTHPNFPAQGLPGTLTDMGDANSRLIGLRFSLNTNCDFIAGSNINLFARANRSCGIPATGNGTRTSSLDINIDGVSADYFIESDMSIKSGSFNNCNSPVVFNVTQTAVAVTPIGATATTQIIIPNGYEYVAGSFVCNDPDTSSAAAYTCPTYLGTFTNVAGQDYIELSIPAGSVSGDKFDFDFTIQKTGVVACGDYSMLLQTVDKVASVACPSAPGGVCTNFTVQTGSKTYDYTVSNPILNITALTATHNAGTYTGTINVANTSAIDQTNSSPANPVQVNFYCADAMGNPTGTILGTYTITGPIVAGASISENYTLSGASACGLGNFVAVISTDNNCVCETTQRDPDLLPIATDDSLCYTQGVLSVPVNVLTNDTTGDALVASTVSLVVPVGATGVVTDAQGDVTNMTIPGEGSWNVDATSGVIYFVPLTSTTLNPTPIQYNGEDIEGNTSNNATVTLTTSISGTVTTTCAVDGLNYNLVATIIGQAPFTVTGTGATGTWVSNGNNSYTWISDPISTSTNYNVDIQDVNACNTLNFSGAAAVCCTFTVTCPTFTPTTVACYANIPTATTLTEAQFEALGNADGVIGNLPCGVIQITASNAASPVCEGNVIRTYTVTEYADPNNNDIRDAGEDTVLNTQTCTQTFTIERDDFTMPANQASTVACAAAIIAPTVPAVTDNCGNALTASAPVVSTTPACEGDVTYTYTFTDCEGNTHDWVYTYTIERADFTMPANQGSTVACAAAIVAPTVPAVTDNCGNALTASAPVVSTTPACEGDVTYTYTFTDCEGNTHDWVYTYTIERADFTMPTNQGSTVACAAAIVAPTVPAVTDNCGNALTASAPVVSATPACEGDVTYTYTFTDCEGNTHDWVYTYTIERADFTMPANQASTVACAAAIVAPTVPAVTDNCGNTLTPSAPVVSATPTCEGDVTYTYTFTDCEGNTHDWVYTYTIDDNIAPTGTTPANLTFQCIADVPVADINAVTDEADNCSGVVTVTVADTNNGGTGCLGNAYIVTRTYTLTDCAGNTTNLVQTITVVDDTDPIFVETLPSNLVLECTDAIPTAPTLTATDNCSIATVIYDEQRTDGSCPSNYTLTRTWTATDACGNEAIHTQVIDVQDTTPPVFTGELPVDGFADCDNIPVAPTVTATDNCGNVTITLDEQRVDGDCSNRYELIRTWTATDDCNNSSTYVQTITLACHIEVFNALSPNGDDSNDVFILEGIDCYPNNTVEIYNRWGVKVFETSNYDNINNAFKGYSDGRSTISRNEKLPTGTYFYILKYEYSYDGVNGKQNIEKAGYLYIQNN